MSNSSTSFDDWAGKLADHIANKQNPNDISSYEVADVKDIRKEIHTLLRKIPKECFREVISYLVYNTHTWTSLPEGSDYWIEVDKLLGNK